MTQLLGEVGHSIHPPDPTSTAALIPVPQHSRAVFVVASLDGAGNYDLPSLSSGDELIFLDGTRVFGGSGLDGWNAEILSADLAHDLALPATVHNANLFLEVLALGSAARYKDGVPGVSPDGNPPPASNEWKAGWSSYREYLSLSPLTEGPYSISYPTVHYDPGVYQVAVFFLIAESTILSADYILAPEAGWTFVRTFSAPFSAPLLSKRFQAWVYVRPITAAGDYGFNATLQNPDSGGQRATNVLRGVGVQVGYLSAPSTGVHILRDYDRRFLLFSGSTDGMGVDRFEYPDARTQEVKRDRIVIDPDPSCGFPAFQLAQDLIEGTYLRGTSPLIARSWNHSATWQLMTIPGTYQSFTSTHYKRTRLVVMGAKPDGAAYRWWVRVGNLQPDLTYAWSGEVDTGITNSSLDAHFIDRSDDVLEFAYLDPSGIGNVKRCHLLSGDGVGNWTDT